MKKIVLIIDSYKGCLSSMEVERAAEVGVRNRYPNVEVVKIPVADGGEGLVDVLVELTGGRKVSVDVHDALMRPVSACFGILGDGTTAVVEMAQASGLPLLKQEERNPMLTTSYGAGELLHQAISMGFRKILMGIGGSATNDGGMGMMQALGAKFYDIRGEILPVGCGKLLEMVEKIDLSGFLKETEGVEVITACDVSNPLCGPRGAASVFAPQKGATDKMVELLEEGMMHFAVRMERVTQRSVSNLPGAGAAGGVGACLSAFWSAPLVPGIDLLLAQMHIEEQVAGADLIITGEGKADRQTLMGKVPAGVLRLGKNMGVDVVLMAGAVEDEAYLRSAGFHCVVEVTPKTVPVEWAMRPDVASTYIQRAVLACLE